MKMEQPIYNIGGQMKEESIRASGKRVLEVMLMTFIYKKTLMQINISCIPKMIQPALEKLVVIIKHLYLKGRVNQDRVKMLLVSGSQPDWILSDEYIDFINILEINSKRRQEDIDLRLVNNSVFEKIGMISLLLALPIASSHLDSLKEYFADLIKASGMRETIEELVRQFYVVKQLLRFEFGIHLIFNKCKNLGIDQKMASTIAHNCIESVVKLKQLDIAQDEEIVFACVFKNQLTRFKDLAQRIIKRTSQLLRKNISHREKMQYTRDNNQAKDILEQMQIKEVSSGSEISIKGVSVDYSRLHEETISFDFKFNCTPDSSLCSNYRQALRQAQSGLEQYALPTTFRIITNTPNSMYNLIHLGDKIRLKIKQITQQAIRMIRQMAPRWKSNIYNDQQMVKKARRILDIVMIYLQNSYKQSITISGLQDYGSKEGLTNYHEFSLLKKSLHRSIHYRQWIINNKMMTLKSIDNLAYFCLLYTQQNVQGSKELFKQTFQDISFGPLEQFHKLCFSSSQNLFPLWDQARRLIQKASQINDPKGILNTHQNLIAMLHYLRLIFDRYDYLPPLITQTEKQTLFQDQKITLTEMKIQQICWYVFGKVMSPQRSAELSQIFYYLSPPPYHPPLDKYLGSIGEQITSQVPKYIKFEKSEAEKEIKIEIKEQSN